VRRVKPIPFTAESTRAINQGRKTQTRRVMTPEPDPMWLMVHAWRLRAPMHVCNDGRLYEGLKANGEPLAGLPSMVAPYAVGDLLWVREPWYCDDYRIPERGPLPSRLPPEVHPRDFVYRADGEARVHFPESEDIDSFRWRNPRFAPRWASRTTLEVLEVRVQRVQEITEADAIAEGIETDRPRADHPLWYLGGPHRVKGKGAKVFYEARTAYADLWDHLNAKRGYSWISNPWIYAYTFRIFEHCCIRHRCGEQHHAVKSVGV